MMCDSRIYHSPLVIAAVWWNNEDPSDPVTVFNVGMEGVTRIEPYREPGHMSGIAAIEVYSDKSLVYRAILPPGAVVRYMKDEDD